MGALEVDITGVEIDGYQVVRTPEGLQIKFDFKIVQTQGTQQGSLDFKALTINDDFLGHSQIKLPSS